MQRKVLIVDDDPGFRKVIEGILADEHLALFEAVDGKDAVAKTLEIKPDLILLDIKMPKLNGLTFCRAIRTGTDTRDIPIIVVTSFTAKGRIEECMEAGADDFIAKPFRAEELLIRVRAMLQTADVSDHIERMNQYILATKEIRDRLTTGRSSG